MTEDVQGRQPAAPGRSGAVARRRLWLVLAIVAALLVAVLVVPPMVSISRYKNRITQLLATSLGRPVRLSSVELRLLPRPGFVLTDLSVAEDPAYGAEPVLHATTVTASIRLLSIWRGRLVIDSISVDDASLNLVRSAPGRWNLDRLFRTAAAQAGGGVQRPAVPLPSLQATNSRINIKNGAEKLPFSLINTDLEFWQESPGEWHIRLRGQPARTDVSLYQEDTGVLRLEATVGRAPSLREMPVQLDLDWREAQLGQLARLVTGSDSGWRGDLTGELHLEGTADAARITTRLRATGVHRAEFAPAEPMDFDANCSLVYHYAKRALEDLDCNSPLGDGRIRVTGDMPGEEGLTRLSLELDHVPIAAGLGALRTVRSDLPPDLDAKGTVSGKIAYAPAAAKPASLKRTGPARKVSSKTVPAAQSSLTGALDMEGFELNGAGLNHPIQVPKVVLEPSENASSPPALTGTFAFPAGGPVPISLNLRLTRSGYQVAMRGPASVSRARELFDAAGIAGPAGFDSLAGDPIAVDLSAEGPWMQTLETPSADSAANADQDGASPKSPSPQGTDRLSGTVTVRNANWKADFLSDHVEIAQATLHLGGGEIQWDPVVFSYGPLKATANFIVPLRCAGPDPCPPRFQVRLGNLDAAALQTTILGVQPKGTLFSELLERLHPSSAPPWPRLEGTVGADSILLGPVTLEKPAAALHIVPTGAEITSFNADLLGGRVHGTGMFVRPATDEDKPDYTFDAQFDGLSAQALGQLIGQRWSGGQFNANGKVELAGYTDRDLARSAKGTLHFEWQHGAAMPTATADSTESASPAVIPAHFDRWTADAAIKDNSIKLGPNQLQQGSRRRSIDGTLTFGDPPAMHVSASNSTRHKNQ
jgi:AsmA family/AsmA-like C-terminal region